MSVKCKGFINCLIATTIISCTITSFNSNINVKASNENKITVEESTNVVNKFEKPKNLQANNLTTASVNLSWEEPNSNVIDYVILQDDVEIATVPATSTNYTVKGLDTNKLYGFKVIARYENNKVSRPTYIKVRTNKGNFDIVTPNKVDNLKAKEVTNNSVLLSWDSPSNNVEVLQYIIYKNGEPIMEIPATSTECLIEDLRSNTLYGFKVVVESTYGNTSRGRAINVRTSK